MIVVIAPETDIENEISTLHRLFEAGLACYHLRKPEKDYKEHITYLKKIDATYHNRIVVHLFHELVNEFNLKGVHFQEQKRKDTIENQQLEYFKNLNMADKTVSSSFHEPEDIASCEIAFDYHLLSPVFSSISKQGYKGRGFDVNAIDKTIVGLGGVTSENIEACKALGYKGVGVLGGIWNNNKPVEAFNNIKQQFE
ncbi:MAG: thiamine phosphate synthase [Psychroflexus halocasei]